MEVDKLYSETFGKTYNLKQAEFVGQGSYAKVYKSFQSQLGKFVAIRKILKSPEVMSDIEKEISINQMLKTVKSEQILEIYDIVQQPECIWYVSEYCEGGSLWEALANSPDLKFSETDSLKVALEIARGVQELHSKRITHRDLKPENILFVESFKPKKEPKLKIADFGLSTCSIIMETIAGTKEYLAPEQAKFNTYTNAVDVWSLGIMLDEMLHGTLFYTGDTNKEVFDKILKIDYEVRDGTLAEETKSLLLRVLRRKAYERPIMASIIKSIEDILSAELRKQERVPAPTVRMFQRRNTHDVVNQDDSRRNLFVAKKDRSTERSLSRKEVPRCIVTRGASIQDLTKIIAQQRKTMQKFRINKQRFLFMPSISPKHQPPVNLVKEHFQKVVPSFGYLNKFSPNDKSYASLVRSTGASISGHLLVLSRLEDETRQKIMEAVLLELDQYIDSAVNQLHF